MASTRNRSSRQQSLALKKKTTSKRVRKVKVKQHDRDYDPSKLPPRHKRGKKKGQFRKKR